MNTWQEVHVRDCLAAVWGWVLEHELGLNPETCRKMGVVLLVPETMTAQEVGRARARRSAMCSQAQSGCSGVIAWLWLCLSKNTT